MTEFEKKQSGQIYDARDPQLRKQQNRAKNLMRKYNDLPAEAIPKRNRFLEELLGYFGRNVHVNQPLYVDYGYNIFLGENSFINMHCTLLDTGLIQIGENTLIGPDVKIYTAFHAVDGADRFWMDADGTAAVKTRTAPVKIGSFTWIAGGNPCQIKKRNRPLAQNVLKKEKKFQLCGEEGQVFDGENKG